LKILLLVPAPRNISPSQRFRFEHYIDLKDHSIVKFNYSSFYSESAWRVLHQNGHLFNKITGIAAGFIKRFFQLFTLFQYDFVYIHREAAPIGPPVFEWLIAKAFRKKIIYDFDDAIWVKLASVANPWVAGLKCSWKVARICKMSYKISVGNNYLAEYASQYCDKVMVIPTVVNTESYHNRLRNQHEGKLTIGWTGTYTNFYNLTLICGAIARLQKRYDFNFLIISNRDPQLENVKYEYLKWRLETEVEDLLKMHIGIMPLVDSEVENGKCAFKAIQYMSLGIPPVLSPVGANKKLVNDGLEGFWAETEEDWYEKIEKLITDSSLRTDMGERARKRIVEEYSVGSNEVKFFDLFQ